MKRTVQILGLGIAILYGSVIVWVYARRPHSFGELKTQASIQASVYSINQQNFDEALKQFNTGDYNSAIGQFRLADPAQADPAPQDYIVHFLLLSALGPM